MERGFPSSREHAGAGTEREPDYRGPESHTGVAPRRSWDPGRAAPPCPCQGNYKWDPSHRLQPTSPGKRERCEGRAAQRREQVLGRAPIPTGTKAPGRPRAPRAQGWPPSPGGARTPGAAGRPEATQAPPGRAAPPGAGTRGGKNRAQAPLGRGGPGHSVALTLSGR